MGERPMCVDHACPSRAVCQRYWPGAWGEPDPDQPFADMERPGRALHCDWFVEEIDPDRLREDREETRNIDGGER